MDFAVEQESSNESRQTRIVKQKSMAIRPDGMSLFRGEPGGVAITVTLQTSRVVSFVLDIGQHPGFGRTQFRVVTGFLAFLASREVALAF